MRQRLDAFLKARSIDMKTASLAGGLGETYVRDVIQRGRGKIELVERVVRALDPGAVDHVIRNGSASLGEGGPPQTLASGYRPPPELLGARDFKVFASAECGPGEIQVFSNDPYELIPRPWNTERDPDAFGVLLTGDSMEPLYEAGQIAIVSPKAPLVKGKQALFLAEPMGGDFRASVKRYRGQTVDKWLVKQLNPEKDFAFERSQWGTAYRVLGALDG